MHLPGGNIFFAGDTGRGDGSWAPEAIRHGPVRLAILPIGAYEPRDVMKANHVNPEEAVAAFEQLRPALALGVHWGTFKLLRAARRPPRRLAPPFPPVMATRPLVTVEHGRSLSFLRFRRNQQRQRAGRTGSERILDGSTPRHR